MARLLRLVLVSFLLFLFTGPLTHTHAVDFIKGANKGDECSYTPDNNTVCSGAMTEQLSGTIVCRPDLLNNKIAPNCKPLCKYQETKDGKVHRCDGSMQATPGTSTTSCKPDPRVVPNCIDPAAPATTTSTTRDFGPGPAGIVQLQELFQRALNLSIAAAFIVIFLLLLSTSVTYMTSAGDPKAIKKASDTITWALLGVLFLALAWLIIKLIEVFTGVNLTDFCIGFPGVPTACIL